MSEDTENKKKDLTVGGVSGSKKMRLGRVHKKKTDEGEAPAAAPAVEAAAPVTPAPAPVEEAKPVKKTAAKKVAEPKSEEQPAEEKKPAKKTTAKTETAAKKTTKKAAEKKEAAAEAEDTKAEVKEEKKATKKTTTKKAKAETAEVKVEEPEKKEPEVKEEVKEVKPEPAPAPEPVVEEKKPEPKPEVKPEPKPETKPRLSSAVISLPDVPARGETIRSSTVITYTGRDKKSPMRSGGQGGYNNNRGGYQGNKGGGGFDKDKDDDNQRPQFKRAPKPRAEAPIEDAKKSRSSYAEKSAFDKKHNNADRRDGEKNTNIDKRKQSRTAQFTGRVNSDGDYDDFSFKKKKKKQETQQAVVEQVITEIKIPAFITVKEFAEGIGKKSSDIIMALMKLGVMATINQELDFDTACLVADSFGINAELLEEKTEEDILFVDEDNPENLETRPPVVVVMGHVDHGKTSLLDKIRSSNVTEGEAGGITQKIGAYTVRLKGRQITFLDTPGHEAFTTMRARGAQFTDIAILVVAADDGVMPQTIEAINHAKAANTEIIVAINKIDKPGANPDRVKQELMEHGVLVEDWGGEVISVPVSAKKGEGITDLLEMILLQADMLELRANPDRLALGTVIEARLDKAKGPVATLLVSNGTLKTGQSVVAGTTAGKIRVMTDDKGKTIRKAGPATAVEILGLSDVPNAGDAFNAVRDDKTAREIAANRKEKMREEVLAKNASMTLEKLFSQIQEGEAKELNLIVKADVQGSVGAIITSLEKLETPEVKINVIHSGVGTINESDVMLAETSNAIIIGFNVRPTTAVTNQAQAADVEIRLYRVIYDIIDEIQDAMKGMLDPEYKEEVLGKAVVRDTFKVPGVGIIAGCYVNEGIVKRNAQIRLVRDGIVIHEGVISSLRRFKDDVREVASGYECGLGIEKYNDIKPDDVIECFNMVEVER